LPELVSRGARGEKTKTLGTDAATDGVTKF